MNEEQLKVTKRNGITQEMSFDKILTRVKNLSVNIEPKLQIGYAQLVMKIIDQLVPNIKTTTIDEMVAAQCASMSTHKQDYGALASRIVVSNHHKNTNPCFLATMRSLHRFQDAMGNSSPLISDELMSIVEDNHTYLQSILDYSRDYLIDYFGFKTLERAYMIKIDNNVIERPQHMWLRVALGIHKKDMKRVMETYTLMSQKYFIHATPTLFNAGTRRPQLSSCYLVAMEEDNIDGIFNTLKECAQISKWAGGIGLHVHNIRATGSYIRGTNGLSNGLTPMLQVYNSTARFVDQGGKRNGSFAIYLEPWHGDIIEWLDLKKNHGDEAMRARDLFYGLWVPDAFMEAVKNNLDWYLMCPDVCKGLADCYGEGFKLKYNQYIQEGKYLTKMKARDLWFKILDSQMETGTPYLCYKDAANAKSNQQNLGVIKSSNLCTEIIEYSDKNQTAVCNLASIGLPMFVNENKEFDYEKLHEVTKVVTYNLNKVIDINYYPTEKTRRSNLLHRPIGIGVQGLADVFAIMKLSFCCDEAKKINKMIFETIYHAAIETSLELSIARTEDMREITRLHEKNNIYTNPTPQVLDVSRSYADNTFSSILEKHTPIFAEIKQCQDGGCPGAYSSFAGSPLSQGKFQFDLWGVNTSERYDWETLRQKVMQMGIRNSLLVAPMPTASTSQILGNNECFEPFTSNIYSRRTLAGEFVLVNKHLMKELADAGLWSDEIKNSIIANKGSVQHIVGLDPEIKKRYLIVWEIPMRELIEMAADRGAFICQSQSLNLWCEEPNYKMLTSMHFFSWDKGLKTGIYYLRRKPRHQPQQFTINPDLQPEEPVCEMCSS